MPEPTADWQDAPDALGLWWVVDPRTPNTVGVAYVHVYAGGVTAARIIGPGSEPTLRPVRSIELRGFKWRKADVPLPPAPGGKADG